MKYPYPWGENHAETIEEANVLVMGVPFDGAVSNAKGSAEAPDRMRELSRILPPVTEDRYLFRDLKVYDHGNAEVVHEWQQYFNQVEMHAQSMLRTGKPCIFLGGDHSLTIPLDPAFAPGTGMPESGGLTSCELLEQVRGLVQELPVAAVDIVEVSPPLDLQILTVGPL